MTINTEPDGMRLRFDPQVVDAGHHQRRLFELTGLRVQENQARALLSDLWRYKAKWEDGVGHAVPDDLAARRWLDEKFYATLGARAARPARSSCPTPSCSTRSTSTAGCCPRPPGRDVGRAAAVDVLRRHRAARSARHPRRPLRPADRGVRADLRLTRYGDPSS